MKARKHSALNLAVALSLASSAALAQERAYDPDRAVIWRMIGGIPDDPVCSRAYGHMIDRTTRRSNRVMPLVPFSVSDGAESRDCDLDHAAFDAGNPKAYECLAGASLDPDAPEYDVWTVSPTSSYPEFCHTASSVGLNDSMRHVAYPGMTYPTYADFVAALTISPGPADEYRAPWFRATHGSYAPRPLSDSEVIVIPKYVADADHNPVAVLDPGVVPALPSCMRTLWEPPTSELCGARWGVARAVGSAHDAAADRRHSCETVGGRTALAMTSYGDKRNALQDFAETIPGGGDAGRMTAQMFIPTDYQPYVAGRLAFGMTVGERKCSGGGCLPDEQGGADIRVNFRPLNGSIVLANYSYHLDRGTPARSAASDWEGRRTDVRSYGRSALMKRALPKGEWITLQLDVVLNTPGRADGSSVLSAYDSQGRLIDSAAHRGVTYRRDASWKISGPALTEKPNDTGPAPKTQAWYFRDYRLATGDINGVCP